MFNLDRKSIIFNQKLYLGFPRTKRANLMRAAMTLLELQAATRYLKRPITQPKGSVSLRRVFPMTAITLFKAWIALGTNEW